MDTNIFSKMTDKKKRQLYETMWKNNPLISDGGIKKTETDINGKTIESDNSYSFVDGNTAEGLIKIFGISEGNRQLFMDKFKMACSGSGKEGRRIATLHSSSLCALMFFYNVTEEHPLTIDGVGTFTESVFEFKSPVIDEKSPSCMDVVLIGKKDDKKIVLFLESKFAEYYLSASGKSSKISNKYLENAFGKEIYYDESFRVIGKIENKEDRFQIVPQNPFYVDGIKQMISHYIGVNNNLWGNYCKQKMPEYQNKVIDAIKSGAKVILGEILFDHKIGTIILNEGQSYKDLYSAKYTVLAKAMNKVIRKSQYKCCFEVLEHDLSYSKIFKGDFADEKVIDFYFR